MYLSQSIRLNIAFAVGLLSKDNIDPKVRHIKAVERILHYLKSTIHLKLIYSSYPKDKRNTQASNTLSPFELIVYGDSSYVGYPKHKKLVMRYCYFINRAIIFQYSKKQKTILILKTKAKYITLLKQHKKLSVSNVYLMSFKSLNPLNISLYIGIIKPALY